MTAKPKTDDDGDGRGCALIIGLVIVGIAVGHMHSAAAGWLIIGVGLIFLALF